MVLLLLVEVPLHRTLSFPRVLRDGISLGISLVADVHHSPGCEEHVCLDPGDEVLVLSDNISAPFSNKK